MSAQTLAQKLVARAAGRATVTPGEIVTCRVDLAMFHDSSGPRRLAPMLRELGATLRDPDRIVVVTDHYVPAQDDDSRKIVQFTRDWVKSQRITRFHDEEGICHVVLPERGYLRPGMFAVGGDSHSPTGGAFGAYMFGVGSTEMLGVVVTGEIWLRVPQTLRVLLDAPLPARVTAKDVMLKLLALLGNDGGGYRAVEFDGPGIAALPMQERMTLANMTAELGAQTGLVPPDATTLRWLEAAGVDTAEIDVAHWHSDPDAAFDQTVRLGAADLVPMVAAPHSPSNGAAATSHHGVPIHVAYVGACTGAKLVDLRMAAEVLRGRKVASGVELWVAPASARDQQAAEAEGLMQVFRDAGATLLPNACGACAGYGPWRFGPGVRALSTTARNFRGRMGDPASEIWLASPYTVAASAIAGHVVDPREMAGA